ncbi:MAG: glucose-6-phosphate dehydrogenase [Candidatus Zipacnadales bacterium]
MSSVVEAHGPIMGRDWFPTIDTTRCTTPAALVLFGATGDLARRKLIPAIYSLTADDLLMCPLPILCVGRRAQNREELIAWLREGIPQFARKQPFNESVWQAIEPRIQYVRGDLHDPATYRAIGEMLAWADQICGVTLGRLFYLATPPDSFPNLFHNLKHHGLTTPNAEGDHWSRLIIEKPFGRDLKSARELNQLITSLFTEEQIFRMDHYLGKETVQNIAVFRFANSIFEPLWNERHIDHVQITMAETTGIEGRAGFFDAVGTLRDVIQNHGLQMLCLVAMEPPFHMAAEALHDEKLKVLRCLRSMSPEEIDRSVVRGQYGPGTIDNARVPGYAQEPRIPPQSRTETFVALRLYIDNWRWAGVPFYIRAGKRLPCRATEIVVTFKRAPHLVFGRERRGVDRNYIVLRIQPDEGIRLCFNAKQPGLGLEIQHVPMDFRYAQAFSTEPPEAYERLILDALVGDRTLFARSDSVLASWEYLTPILEHWAAQEGSPHKYPAGSWGPPEADRLIEWTGDYWHNPI